MYKNYKLILTNYYYISVTNTVALQINKNMFELCNGMNIMPHMNIVLIQWLFFKIDIILSFGEIWFHNLEFSKQTIIWHKNILRF